MDKSFENKVIRSRDCLKCIHERSFLMAMKDGSD